MFFIKTWHWTYRQLICIVLIFFINLLLYLPVFYDQEAWIVAVYYHLVWRVFIYWDDCFIFYQNCLFSAVYIFQRLAILIIWDFHEPGIEICRIPLVFRSKSIITQVFMDVILCDLKSEEKVLTIAFVVFSTEVALFETSIYSVSVIYSLSDLITCFWI